MGNYHKIELDNSITLEKLKERLRSLLDRRTDSYSDSVVQSCFDALERYWTSKVNGQFVVVPKWNEIAPEAVAVILEDMFSNPNRLTEAALRSRDESLLNGGSEQDLIRCKSAVGDHLLVQGEGVILNDYLYAPVIHRLGLSSSGISPEALGKKFQRTSSFDDLTREQAYVSLPARLEQSIEVIKQFDSLESSKGLVMKSDESLLDIVLNEAKQNIDSTGRIVLLKSPRTLASRLNFINYLNTEYNDSKPYDATVRFRYPDQFTRLLNSSDTHFMDHFDYEMSDMVSRTKYRNEIAFRKISFSKMEEAILADPFIRNRFLAVNKHYKTLLDENPELREAISEGEPAYSAFLNTHEEYRDVVERTRDIARSELRRLFFNSEFGFLTPREKERLDKLSGDVLDHFADKEKERPSYTAISLEGNSSNGESKDSGLPALIETPRRRRSDPYDPLQDVEARKFISDVVDDDVTLEGIISTNVGTKANGKDKVYYYAFKFGENEEYRLLEPIGQPHNATFVVESNLPFEEFCEALSRMKVSLDRFEANDEMMRIYQSIDGKELIDCPNRVKLIIENILKGVKAKEEISQETGEEATRSLPLAMEIVRNSDAGNGSIKPITLQELSEFVTGRVEIGNLKEAERYIAHVYVATEPAISEAQKKKPIGVADKLVATPERKTGR